MVDTWFSPLNWFTTNIDTTGKSIINFATSTHFGKGRKYSWTDTTNNVIWTET